ncbi:hypothetical protein IWW55_003297, partial [Coemansia sp. RSA 2706]
MEWTKAHSIDQGDLPHTVSESTSFPSKSTAVTGHISSPLTLLPGDAVELVVSHRPTSSATPDIQAATTSRSSAEMLGWSDLPVGVGRVEVPASPEHTEFVSKRSHNPDASSLTSELLSEAAESARSLLSAMRNIATQSENAHPSHRAASSPTHTIRDQFVYPDEELPAIDTYQGSSATEPSSATANH